MEKAKFVDTKICKSITEHLSKRDHSTLVLWAMTAPSMYSLFRREVPEDNRPQKAIEAGRGWVRGEIA